MLYMNVVKRVNLSPHYKEKYFFSISLILHLYEMMDIHWTYCGNQFMTYVSKIILYVVNLHSAIGH